MMNKMLKRLRKYLKRKGIKLNADKCFRKAGGRWKKYDFKYKGKKLEVVKSFTYLEYELKGNNKENSRLKKVKGKTNGCAGRI